MKYEILMKSNKTYSCTIHEGSEAIGIIPANLTLNAEAVYSKCPCQVVGLTRAPLSLVLKLA